MRRQLARGSKHGTKKGVYKELEQGNKDGKSGL
jgi:hypothetical protein